MPYSKHIEIIVPSNGTWVYTDLFINDATKRRDVTTITKINRTLYSLFKNAIAPSLMAPLRYIIFSFPGLCFLTLKNRNVAKSKATIPPIGAIIDISI